MDVCVLSGIPSPLLGRARSSPPVCRCHGWTSSFAYICMPSNGAAADSFQSRPSSWTPAQSCRHGYAATRLKRARGGLAARSDRASARASGSGLAPTTSKCHLARAWRTGARVCRRAAVRTQFGSLSTEENQKLIKTIIVSPLFLHFHRWKVGEE